jgi:hypothetical protein
MEESTGNEVLTAIPPVEKASGRPSRLLCLLSRRQYGYGSNIVTDACGESEDNHSQSLKPFQVFQEAMHG